MQAARATRFVSHNRYSWRRHSGNYCDDHCSPCSAESAPLPKVDLSRYYRLTRLHVRSIDWLDLSRICWSTQLQRQVALSSKNQWAASSHNGYTKAPAVYLWSLLHQYRNIIRLTFIQYMPYRPYSDFVYALVHWSVCPSQVAPMTWGSVDLDNSVHRVCVCVCACVWYLIILTQYKILTTLLIKV